MEKRFALALGLSVLILLGWSLIAKSIFPPPPEPPPEAAKAPVSAPAATPPPPTAGATAAPAAAPRPSVASAPPATAPAAEQDLSVDTQAAAIVLTNKGGRVRSWRLHGYDTAGHPVDFVSDAARRKDVLPLALAFDDAGTLPEANSALYEVKRDTGPGGADRVVLSWSDGAGSTIRKVFTFPKSGGLVGVEVEAVDRGRKVTPRLVWGPGLEVEDPKNRANTYYNGQALLLESGHVLRLPKRKIDVPTSVPESVQLDWAGLADQYFAALILPAGSRGSVTIAPLPLSALARPGVDTGKELADAPTIAVALPEGKAELFVGPKNFGLLASFGHGLERAVWFSDYTLIYACAKPVFLALRWVHANWVGNWGLAIILLTVGLRLLLFPLNQYSMVKMRKVAGEMQRVQPKLKAIQAKYKKSKDPEARAKMNAETMELYKKEGVNPFGGVSGCLPLFVQMPILWAFFDVLTATVELRGAPFLLWIQDLTHPDRFWITPILMGATMMAQQKMTPTANVDPAQQRMMMFMPIMFTVMFLTLPSGLVLYYFVNNLLGIGQQWLVNRHVLRLQQAEPKKA
jgi:YidC/Oxa1 family membrane protein insertase